MRQETLWINAEGHARQMTGALAGVEVTRILQCACMGKATVTAPFSAIPLFLATQRTPALAVLNAEQPESPRHGQLLAAP